MAPALQSDVGRPGGGRGLEDEIGRWIRMEAEDRELQAQVAPALEGIREFIARHRSELERRKGRLLQTSGFRDETQAMEAGLAKIQQLLASGRNVSAIFSVIDGFLARYKGDAAFDREQIRIRLADARDDQVCRLHDAMRGTRLARLFDVLYFMPYSSWRSRGVERRNFRSPASADVQKILEECRQRGVDCDGMDPVELAVVVRLRLGITPRMDSHKMTANKLAERLTDPETLARFASREVPLDQRYCRPVSAMLADIRRWSAECFGRAPGPAPPEIEAEMLQIAYCAGDIVRLGGTGKERMADFLWLLATVVAADHAMLDEVLSRLLDRHSAHPSVRERILAAKRYLEAIAPIADGILAGRWAEAKEELAALIARSDEIVSKGAVAFAEFTELEGLKERRSDVVKSLIKLSDSIQLVEPALLGAPAPSAPAARLAGSREGPGPPDPVRLRDRNYKIAGETAAIARQELERLRALIERMTAISRKGFGDSGAPAGRERRRDGERTARTTSDGVELGGLSVADLHEKLRGALQKAGQSLREFRGKVEGVRRRNLKSELQHPLNVLYERIRKAAETFEGLAAEGGEASRALADAEALLPSLRDMMAAHVSLGTRVGNARLTPAEKSPLTALLYIFKTRVGEDLRDLERLCAELAERVGGVGCDGADEAPGEAQSVPGRSHAHVAREIAGLVASANAALRPVKELLAEVGRAVAARERDGQAVARAAVSLRAGIGRAQEVMADSRARVEAAAAGSGAGVGEHLEKIDRWRGQLSRSDGEARRLFEAAEAVAGAARTVEDAAAHERGLSETLRPPSERTGGEPFVPIRERCARALAALTEHLDQVRAAQAKLAEATNAPWSTLKSAPGYLAACQEGLAASERELRAIHARIEKIHHRFKADRPRPA